MRTHKGMRPHDLVVLLKIISIPGQEWKNKDLASHLFISTSEITDSLERSAFAGLLHPSKKEVFTLALTDFIIHGLRYVFPAAPGPLSRGIPTAHSAPVMLTYFSGAEPYVWPDPEGTSRGESIAPLYPGIVAASRIDPKLYDLLALCDVFRIGKTREIKIARDLLPKLLKENNVKRY